MLIANSTKGRHQFHQIYNKNKIREKPFKIFGTDSAQVAKPKTPDEELMEQQQLVEEHGVKKGTASAQVAKPKAPGSEEPKEQQQLVEERDVEKVTTSVEDDTPDVVQEQPTEQKNPSKQPVAAESGVDQSLGQASTAQSRAGFHDLDLYKNFQLEAQVSPYVGRIMDLLVFDNKLVALVREEGDYYTGKRKLVELDDAGQEVRVICSEKLGVARRATSSGGKIVVASRDEGLLSVTLDGRVETIVRGKYDDCRTADDGSVFAVRVTPRGKPVIIDIMTNEKLVRTVQTHIKSAGDDYTLQRPYTVVPGSASHVALVGSWPEHCVFEVSLSDGSTLNTYGHHGRSRGAGAGELCGLILCFKLNHDVVVADVNNNRLQILNPTRSASREKKKKKSWSIFKKKRSESWSILNTSAKLHYPCAAVNKQGKLYVASFYVDGLYILK